MSLVVTLGGEMGNTDPSLCASITVASVKGKEERSSRPTREFLSLAPGMHQKMVTARSSINCISFFLTSGVKVIKLILNSSLDVLILHEVQHGKRQCLGHRPGTPGEEVLHAMSIVMKLCNVHAS